MIKKIILSLLALGFVTAGFFAYRLFKPAVRIPGEKNSYFYVPTGTGMEDLKNELVSQGYIKGPGFGLATTLLRFKKVKPGRYKFSSGMSLFRLVRLLRAGNQTEVKMVIIKERTKEIFAGKFGRGRKFDSECDSSQMIAFLNNPDSLSKYGADSNTVMALVLPYTYSLKWNSTADKIFRQLAAAYRNFWTKERKEKADSLHLSPLQVSILASIVEEETNRPADKLNIASTYLNRLRTGMKLQADPTIKFALKDFSLKRITGTHLQVVSPYNTYLNTGLPPGPICTPSPESIDAVLNAPATDFLYFVASDKFDGSSVFTADYDEHLKFARLYQQELTRRMDSSKKAKAK